MNNIGLPLQFASLYNPFYKDSKFGIVEENTLLELIILKTFISLTRCQILTLKTKYMQNTTVLKQLFLVRFSPFLYDKNIANVNNNSHFNKIQY